MAKQAKSEKTFPYYFPITATTPDGKEITLHNNDDIFVMTDFATTTVKMAAKWGDRVRGWSFVGSSATGNETKKEKAFHAIEDAALSIAEANGHNADNSTTWGSEEATVSEMTLKRRRRHNVKVIDTMVHQAEKALDFEDDLPELDF